MHFNEEFYKVHKDSGKKHGTGTRKITFVYYFHNLPRQFTGGDLLLFDTDLKKNKYIDKSTRIEPLNNSVLFFPSDFYHLVTPVLCETDRIENGRFTINGWLNEEENSCERDK